MRVFCLFQIFRVRAAVGLTALALAAGLPVQGQSWVIHPAPRLELPVRPDGNSATFWAAGTFRVFTSTGEPLMISIAGNQFTEWQSERVEDMGLHHVPLWVEAVQRDRNLLLAWYHHEPGGVCPQGGLTAPKIGAAISRDYGLSLTDLGIILESGYPVDCSAKNGFFAGGHGDFSAISDRERKFIYFFFTNYSGPREQQGICVARLAWQDRFSPPGNVWKYFQGRWDEPGLGGRCTPVFPARVEWQRADTDSFWGPAVHYNTYLKKYVMLLNRSCCSPEWPQEGIYISFSDPALDPPRWSEPVKLMDRDEIGFLPGYYPQVIGLHYGETDTLAGQRARLYVSGISDWEITFFRNSAAAPPPAATAAPRE